MKKGLLLIATILLLASCGGGGKKNNPPPTIPSPIEATLFAPAQNAVCTTGTIVSSSESSILFTWGAANNADNYDLVVKNLLTSNTTTQNTTQTQLTITLLRNTPYSWYIVSKSAKTTVTAQSATWKFYNAGPGVVTYAPFPAEILSPTFAQSEAAGTVNLTWQGSAVDNSTIANYDIYFGTATTPPLLKANVTDSFLDNVAISSGNTYYWKVITRDIDGNTSDSGVSQFSVK